MASKKKGAMKMHCRIFLWVKDRDPKFAEAIQDLCLEGRLSAGRRGVTFLYPGDAAQRKEIAELVQTDTAEAHDRVSALIIAAPLMKADDFQGDVGSLLGVKLTASAVSGDAVTLPGGAKLRPAKDFRPLHKDNIALWEIEEGRAPSSPRDWVPPAGRRGGRAHRSAVGGQAADAGASRAAATARGEIAARVKKDYTAWLGTRHQTKKADPYLVTYVSFLNVLKAKAPLTWEAVLPLIDRDPFIGLYLLLEPYKTSGDYMVPTDFFDPSRGWAGGAATSDPAAELEEQHFKQVSLQTRDSAEVDGAPAVPLVFRDSAGANTAVDNVRVELVGTSGNEKASIKDTPSAVEAAYANLTLRNMVGGQPGFLPDATRDLLPGMKKLWQDEIREFLREALYEGSSRTHGDLKELAAILAQSYPGNAYDAERPYTSSSKFAGVAAPPRANLDLLVGFINSSHFLYAATSGAKVGAGDHWGDIPKCDHRTMDNLLGGAVLNCENGKRKYLGSMEGCEAVDVSGAVAEINQYIRTHGRPPPGLKYGSAPAGEEE